MFYGHGILPNTPPTKSAQPRPLKSALKSDFGLHAAHEQGLCLFYEILRDQIADLKLEAERAYTGFGRCCEHLDQCRLGRGGGSWRYPKRGGGPLVGEAI